MEPRCTFCWIKYIISCFVLATVYLLFHRTLQIFLMSFWFQNHLCRAGFLTWGFTWLNVNWTGAGLTKLLISNILQRKMKPEVNAEWIQGVSSIAKPVSHHVHFVLTAYKANRTRYQRLPDLFHRAYKVVCSEQCSCGNQLWKTCSVFLYHTSSC